jgi:hypothetical protein
VFCGEPVHPWQGLDEDLGHLGTCKVPGDKAKRPHSRFQECSPLDKAMLDVTVLGQDRPSQLSDFREPVLVAGILGKQVIVDSHIRARSPKRIGDYLFSERSIQKENERLKLLRLRARNGSLLRSPTFAAHSRSLTHLWIHHPYSAQQ